MGITLGLAVNPQNIDPTEWRHSYLQTIKLIDAYPAMTLRKENYLGEERLVYSSTIERNIDNLKKRYWSVCGNAELKTHAESFMLHSNIKYYDSWRSYNEDDILFTYLEKDKDPRYIFKNKTQGKDYHKLILAVSMLIENNFPGEAIVTGVFNQKEIGNALKLMQSVLDKNIKTPILADKERLFKKMHNRYDNHKLIDNFYYKFRGYKQEMFDFLLQKFNKVIIEDWIKRHLVKKNYSVDSYGASVIYKMWFNAGLDIDSLLKICCYDDDGPGYKEGEFTEELDSRNYFADDKSIENNYEMLFNFSGKEFSSEIHITNLKRLYFEGNRKFDLENELYKIKANLKSENMESKEKRFKFLISLIFNAKQPLTEKAWDRLEKIENLKLLNFLIFIYLNENRNKIFLKMREYFTENIDCLVELLNENGII
ncbi:MAG: hypothetical protein ACOC2I_04295 [Halanaerobium sp.]